MQPGPPLLHQVALSAASGSSKPTTMFSPGALIGLFQGGLLSIRRLRLLTAISRGADFNNIADLVDRFLDTPRWKNA